jgi:hypothetical protein
MAIPMSFEIVLFSIVELHFKVQVHVLLLLYPGLG